jgi:sodium/hydrogen antiporter
MSITLWIILGALLVVMALTGSVLKRLPFTSAILYLLAGFGLGPYGYNLLRLDPLRQAALLEFVTEIAVIISLFTAGLKLRTPLRDGRWLLPVRLASVSMCITVGLVTFVGWQWLRLPLGAAVLLGAVLAPTDPVLASDVQVETPNDRDRLRFALTGEAGLNDGTAFPFVMLGLGLMGLHTIGSGGWRWFTIDVGWATLAGLGIGGLLGTLIGRLILYLRLKHREAVGLDDFLALGLIALSYGMALWAHAYGFLAVFAAGLALRQIERQESGEEAPEEIIKAAAFAEHEEVATDPDKAPAYMAQAVLGFNEQLERMGEVGVVLLLGAMLSTKWLIPEALWFVPLLLLVIRPISVGVGLLGSRTSQIQRNLIGWFGIRGIGSMYYLMYAINHGLPPSVAERLTALTFLTIAVSIVVHGISVTPLMNLYTKHKKQKTP